LLIGFLASKLLHVPLFYDSHEIWAAAAQYPNSSKIMQLYWDFVEKKLIKKAEVVFHTTESRALYIKKKYDVNNILILRNTSPFKNVTKTSILQEEFGIADNRIILIYHGAINKDRGVFDLANAISEINNVSLVFMGMGDSVSELRSKVRELNIADKVFFKKPVNPDDLVGIISSADIGIQPFHNTLNIYTAISIKLLECIMAGLACVGVDFPEIGKIIKEKKIGNTFESGNVEQLKEAIIDLTENPEKLQRCKENALKIRQQYCWEVDEKILIEQIRKHIK
jgi:glycosyltransferase involved in cell wall biosynthesis